MKKFTIIAVFAFVASAVLAQDAEENPFVNFSGKVLDAETNAPIAASITYERMPNGSDIGFISSRSSDGAFSFYLRPTYRYSVSVKADGYFNFVEIYDASSGSNGALNADIMMRPGGVGSVITLENLIFAAGKSEITEESFDELDKLALMLESTPTMEIQLEGHTDYAGSAGANLALSEQRVLAVKAYLQRKGIDGARVATKAFGGSNPIVRDNDVSKRSANRRVEVRITKN